MSDSNLKYLMAFLKTLLLYLTNKGDSTGISGLCYLRSTLNCIPAIPLSVDTGIMSSLNKLATAWLVNLHNNVTLFSMGFMFIRR